jgi:hypothetical protein
MVRLPGLRSALRSDGFVSERPTNVRTPSASTDRTDGQVTKRTSRRTNVPNADERSVCQTSVGVTAPPAGWANNKQREGGDPNPQKIVGEGPDTYEPGSADGGTNTPSAMRVDDLIPPGYLDIPALVSRTGVEERWLKNVCRTGRIPSQKIRCRVGRAGWKYVISENLADRIRLMYIRRRRMAVNSEARAIHRNGVYYHHDGTISRTR